MASISSEESLKSRLSECSGSSATSILSEDTSIVSHNDDESTVAAQNQNIRVVTRIRPLSQKELNEQSKETVIAIERSHKIQVNKNKNFTYDAVFGPKTTQKEVYELTAGDMIRNNLFKGFNVTVLAYGQTGSGKTHTIFGGNGNMISNQLNEELDGIIPRAVHDVFSHMDQIMCGYDRMKVSMSYLEIYNEEARDLLSPDPTPPELQIRDSGGEVVVQNLTTNVVNSPVEVASLMETASEKRSTAATLMNATSSRSHAICTLYITIAPLPDQDENEDEITAKLTLVDLAGSERAKKTGAEGTRLKEGININKGLFVLGQVVSSLSELGQQTGGSDSSSIHVKYRDSKLTRLLQDSLGGNSKTVMVACVSPADSNTDETINTLRYAERTRSIKNSAVRNVVAVPLSPAEAAALRRENQMLKLQLFQAQAQISSMSSMPSTSVHAREYCTSTKSVINGSQETVVGSGSQRIVDDELNGLTLKDLDVMTKLKMHCTSMEEKINQLEIKNKATVDDCVDASLRADKWQLRYEALMNHLKDSNAPVPEKFDEDDTSGLVENLRKEIVDLKDQIGDSVIDAEVSRSVAAAILKNGDIDAAETMAMVSGGESNEVDEDDSDEMKIATDAITAELVAMSGNIEQKEDMISRIQKERELMETMRSHFEAAIVSLQEEVDTLSSERDTLITRLERDDGTKDDGQTRKLRERTKNLESRIKELKRKAAEHTKSLRLQSQAEKKCQQLQAELTADKKRRAELQRKLKKESVERRNIQKKARIDATKMLRDSQKLKLELNKVKEAAAKQENVLRRKAAEAIHRQKLLAERSKKRARASASLSSDISSQRKEEITGFVEREIGNAFSLQKLQEESEENKQLLSDVEEKREIIISQQRENEDSAIVRSLDAEIELRSKIIEQLERNMREIYKSANRNPKISDKCSSKFIEHHFWQSLNKSEVRFVALLLFIKLVEHQLELESLKSNHKSHIANEVGIAISTQRRESEKEMMKLKVRHAEDMANLLESTKETVKNDVHNKFRESLSTDDAKDLMTTMLENFFESYTTVGNKVESELQDVKANQEGMKRLVDGMADEIISQNEAKAILAAKKKKTKKMKAAELEAEDIFYSDDEKEDVPEDGDDSDWSPDTPMPKKKKMRPSVEEDGAKSPESSNNDKRTQDSYEKMTVVQLKVLLRENGLTVSGKKAELIQRLKFYGSAKARDVVTASAKKRDRSVPCVEIPDAIFAKKLRLQSPLPPTSRRRTPRGSNISNTVAPSSSRKIRLLTSSTKASLLRRRTPTEHDTASLVTKRGRTTTRKTSRSDVNASPDSNSNDEDKLDKKVNSSIHEAATPRNQSIRLPARITKKIPAPLNSKSTKNLQSSVSTLKKHESKVITVNTSLSGTSANAKGTRPISSQSTCSISTMTNSNATSRSRSSSRKTVKENTNHSSSSSRKVKPTRQLTVKTARAISGSPLGRRKDRALSSITNSAKKRRTDRRQNMAKSVNAALAELEKLNDAI